ncbi:hypothetical protein [Prevotella intermedia]|uniref:hypothetical protein n=1 Tax=Prevotella intermedia TaxID=28131 RepID=UPI003975A389
MKKENDAALQTFKKGVAQIKPDSDPNMFPIFMPLWAIFFTRKVLIKKLSRLTTAVCTGDQRTLQHS